MSKEEKISLRSMLKKKPLGDDVDLHEIARTTAGFVGADLENLMNEAAIQAAKNNRGYIVKEDIDQILYQGGHRHREKEPCCP